MKLLFSGIFIASVYGIIAAICLIINDGGFNQNNLILLLTSLVFECYSLTKLESLFN